MPAIVTDLSAETLARELESFLAEHPGAAVLEDGRVLFDMREARYALSAEHGRCVLQLWSEERNIVRTVTGLDVRKDAPAPAGAAIRTDAAADAAPARGPRSANTFHACGDPFALPEAAWSMCCRASSATGSSRG